MRNLAERKPKRLTVLIKNKKHDFSEKVKCEMTMDHYIDEKDKELGRARLSQGGEGTSAC